MSCVRLWGGARVSSDLSDEDVHAIELLIRQTDKLPVIEIRRLERGTCAEEVCGQIMAGTGIQCGGALTGYGHEGGFRRDEGVWQVIDCDVWNG